MSEQRWWFSVSWVDYPLPHRRVERFETMEQALLHAAATGGLVPFQDFYRGITDFSARRLYHEYLVLSEPTK